jgi:predicted DNA-binding ribbon-helix-helix protein
MKIRTYHTSLNLLIEPATYQRLKMIARLKKTTMSKLVREGIKLKLALIDKENDAVMGGQ